MAVNEHATKHRERRTHSNLRGVVRPDRQFIDVFSERRALMRADAALRCVAVALEYDGWTSDAPDHADAIGVVHELISRSMSDWNRVQASPTAGSVSFAQESST